MELLTLSSKTKKDVPLLLVLLTVGYYAGVVLICIPFVFVFLWMALGALKTQVQNTASPPVWIFAPTFENFRKVFLANQFLKYIESSLIVSGGATLLALTLGLPAAHVIARYRQRGLALGDPGGAHGTPSELCCPVFHPVPEAGVD